MDPSRLVLSARRGNVTDYNRLVLASQDAVYQLALALLGDPDQAEALTQAAFDQAFPCLAACPPEDFRGWILGRLVRLFTNRQAASPPDAVIENPLGRLPPEERLAVALVDLLGCDYTSAARLAGLPVAFIRTQVARGRLMLTPNLKENLPCASVSPC